MRAIGPVLSHAAHGVAPAKDLGLLPEWDLSALYPSMESPAYAADLQKAAAQCKDFNLAWRGKLDAIARSPQGAQD